MEDSHGQANRVISSNCIISSKKMYIVLFINHKLYYFIKKYDAVINQ